MVLNISGSSFLTHRICFSLDLYYWWIYEVHLLDLLNFCRYYQVLRLLCIQKILIDEHNLLEVLVVYAFLLVLPLCILDGEIIIILLHCQRPGCSQHSFVFKSEAWIE